jgi:hypothetical protein
VNCVKQAKACRIAGVGDNFPAVRRFDGAENKGTIMVSLVGKSIEGRPLARPDYMEKYLQPAWGDCKHVRPSPDRAKILSKLSLPVAPEPTAAADEGGGLVRPLLEKMAAEVRDAADRANRPAGAAAASPSQPVTERGPGWPSVPLRIGEHWGMVPLEDTDRPGSAGPAAAEGGSAAAAAPAEGEEAAAPVDDDFARLHDVAEAAWYGLRGAFAGREALDTKERAALLAWLDALLALLPPPLLADGGHGALGHLRALAAAPGLAAEAWEEAVDAELATTQPGPWRGGVLPRVTGRGGWTSPGRCRHSDTSLYNYFISDSPYKIILFRVVL